MKSRKLIVVLLVAVFALSGCAEMATIGGAGVGAAVFRDKPVLGAMFGGVAAAGGYALYKQYVEQHNAQVAQGYGPPQGGQPNGARDPGYRILGAENFTNEPCQQGTIVDSSTRRSMRTEQCPTQYTEKRQFPNNLGRYSFSDYDFRPYTCRGGVVRYYDLSGNKLGEEMMPAQCAPLAERPY